MISRRDPAPRSCYLVADLHLDGTDARFRRFQALLESAEREVEDLYILGDLFHYWYGRKHLGLPMYARELHLLGEHRKLGIHVLPGNRDFLLEQAFSQRTGVDVAGDSLAIQLGGESVHLSHGDLFGTSDVAYQRMRRVLHSGMVRFLAHHLPGPIVRSLAARLRRHSERVVPEKSEAVLQPDRQRVAELFARGFHRVICGHFHRPLDEMFPAAAGGGRFIILEPFEERGFALAFKDGAWSERWIGAEEPYEN